ncbi:MAG: sigma-E factor negative regulatory protein [Methylomicrobium sp.]|nr:sigma-E factor negative regulatory protein [Methylomicrobium sp.]
MVDELNQKISQLLDDDLNFQESLSLLKKMHAHPGLQQQLHRYEAISHVLKSDTFVPVDADFAQRISRSLQTEPVYLATRRKPFKKSYASISALAASIAAVAVLVSQGINQSSQPHIMPLSQSQSVTMAANAEQQDSQPNLDHSSEKELTKNRFIKYLQAHNSSRYIDGAVNLQPYARTVQYQQE